MKDLDTPGKRLRWFIKEVLQITQLDVADTVGLTQATISNYMKDSREMDFAFLVKLKENFRLNPTWIITGEGNSQLPNSSEIQNSIETLEKLRSQHFQAEMDPALKEVFEGIQKLAKSDRASLEIVRNLVMKFLERE